MTERVRCCVPFCKHTRGERKGDTDWPWPKGSDWICGEHWMPIRSMRRRAYRRARKASVPDERLWPMWSALKREAIEKAMGI